MKAVILAARLTPIGSFQGALRDISAVDLGIAAARAAIGDVKDLQPGDIADVLVGNVLQAGLGMNVARQIALGCGVPHHVPGQTINRVCGSGMQAVISATDGISVGAGDLYLAGGTESMSRAPFLVTQMRAGHKFGDAAMIDSMVHDGLTDPTHQYHMGITAENVAARWNVSRQEQDAFALESHCRATAAQDHRAFDAEIVAINAPARKGDVRVSVDESARRDTSLEALAKLRPAFRRDGGTVTAGNASGLNDGAAMLVIASEDYARAHGLQPMAEIVAYATVGVDPAYMGIGPTAAIPEALRRSGLSLDEIDLIELNEAFAAQAIVVCRELALPASKVNVSGGAIALGHPIGSSGARVLVTLLHGLRARKKTYGIGSLCIGGGMGIAVTLRAV